MESKKVLLVDEDKQFLDKTRLMLEKYSFEVLTCDSLKEAEEIAGKFAPDLAIIDLLKSNDDSGFVLAYKLRRIYKTLPIIIISSVSARSGVFFSDDHRDWLHVDSIMEKDISSDQLLKDVFKLLKI